MARLVRIGIHHTDTLSLSLYLSLSLSLSICHPDAVDSCISSRGGRLVSSSPGINRTTLVVALASPPWSPVYHRVSIFSAATTLPPGAASPRVYRWGGAGARGAGGRAGRDE